MFTNVRFCDNVHGNTKGFLRNPPLQVAEFFAFANSFFHHIGATVRVGDTSP